MSRSVLRNLAAIGGLGALVGIAPLVAFLLGRSDWRDFALVVAPMLGIFVVAVVGALFVVRFSRAWIDGLELMRRRALARRLGPYERELLARIPKEPEPPPATQPYR